MAQIPTQGTCVYCGKSFNKRGITRHIKSCKARQKAHQAAIATNASVRLVHLQVWGEYLPEYWMHLEVPADLPLQKLDQFLRDTWLECCDHLSHFIVGNTYYEAITEAMIYGQPDYFAPGGADGDTEAAEGFMVPPLVQLGLPAESPGLLSPSDLFAFDDEEDGDEDEGDDDFDDLDEEAFSQLMVGDIMAHFAASGQDRIDRDAMFNFLMSQLGDDDTLNQFTPQERDEALAALRDDIAQMIPAEGLDNPFKGMPPINPFMHNLFDGFGFMPRYEERDMDISLGEVVQPGLEFRHEYDYGSTTELKLKVVDIFDGAAPDEDVLRVVARNDPPQIMCESCGQKLATQICPYCQYDYDKPGWLCDDCAKGHPCTEEIYLLPVVNSPRAGVCGYTGDAEYYDDDEAFSEDFQE